MLTILHKMQLIAKPLGVYDMTLQRKPSKDHGNVKGHGRLKGQA